ncbi:MAG: CRISPR-associated endonuclease Cas3'' [Polyangiaceae bacterium]|nr:CRISPR-associated endonuclease Cas3'' [Polyangiaceae bacterium]
MEPSVLKEPLAHLTAEGKGHLLIDHLKDVAQLAREFAAPFDSGEVGYVAGLWHDIGKYAANFQKMIREKNGFEAHIEGDASGPRDHSSAGAILADDKGGAVGKAVSFLIAGHHAGLANRAQLRERLSRKRDEARCLERAVEGGAPTSILEMGLPTLPSRLEWKTSSKADVDARTRVFEMWMRLVFSALCDADFLDTERFYDEAKAERRGQGPQIGDLLVRLKSHLDALEKGARDTEVNRARADVRKACKEAAHLNPGVFSLTVPTGGGKTLASLAFALEHAQTHGLRRVVVGIPFTSIIEQTADVYRKALGSDGAVLEHHSALDPRSETPYNRIASDNWDAPVIVTTTVQLLESLFANRPGRCRKLHRLVKSVIVLDEAQTLPPGLLEPAIDGLHTLVKHFGASIVICTATQPALNKSTWLTSGFEKVHEIIPESYNLFSRLKRVETRWPLGDSAPSYAELAREIAGERDVLAIVHKRDDARVLTKHLDELLQDESTFHLSALMCAEHRSKVLATIKEKKLRGEPVRLVSTQLVEAGVDVDFAVVYRALGGLDSLAQAAGRCNREGLLDGLGQLRVYQAPTQPPRGVPVAALGITKGMLRTDPHLDLNAKDSFRRYFQQLYASRNLDEKQIQLARREYRFKDVAELFTLIEDEWSEPIVVPFGDAAWNVIGEIEKWGPSRERLRFLQRLTVNVARRDRDTWVEKGYARWVGETVVVLDESFSGAYTNRFGLVPTMVGGASYVV